MDIIELGKKTNDIPYILVSHSFVVEKVPIMYAIRMVKLNSTMKVLTDEKSHPSLSTLYSALNFYFLHVWT
jgi:ABC-type oligopeptide transport system ATPase subunit